MSDPLLSFAYENIWCNPRQDRQYTIQPKRLTYIHGAINRAVVIDRTISLPTKGDVYHIFQIGQILTNSISIKRDEPDWQVDRWIDLHELMIAKNVLLNLYNQNGVSIPGMTSYLMWMDEHDLILAVKETSQIPVNYRTDPFYLRTYHNAYYDSTRAGGSIYVDGEIINNSTQAAAFQANYEGYKTRPGKCFCYINGYLVDDLSVATMVAGSVVEFVYDPSIAKVVSYRLRDMKTYLSVKDNNRKYLIHYPKDGDSVIEFFDDADCYVVKKNNTNYKGIYNYRHHLRSARMVTHRDFGLSVDDMANRCFGLRSLIDDDDDILEYWMRVYIRESGYDRSLVYEHHRLHELYKLNEQYIEESLLGTGDSTNVWRCEVLEANNYTKIMAALDADFTKGNVVDGLGYSSVSTYFGNTPQKVPGVGYVEVPHILQTRSTVYEYDSDGKMLNCHIHTAGPNVSIIDPLTRTIEVLQGHGSHSPECFIGDSCTIPPDCNYRVYLTHKLGGHLLAWDHITYDPLCAITGDQFQYHGLSPDHIVMLRTDRDFLAYDTTAIADSGVLTFLLTEVSDVDGDLIERPLTVSWLQLDIFLNGYSLIEGIDYSVDYPRVVVHSKRHLKQPTQTEVQNIHIRFRGLSDHPTEWEKPKDIGYIEYGYMSNNNRHDIRDDQVLRITMNGRIKTREDVVFSEGHVGVSLLDSTNGMPYMVRDIVVPMRGLVADRDTYGYRQISLDMNDIVSDYMTSKMPQPPRPGVFVIPELYPMYSPFISRLIDDIINGAIPSTEYTRVLSPDEVRTICSPYEMWLKHDPISAVLKQDERVTIIHPYPHYGEVMLTLHAYRFLLQAIALYATSRIELSGFIVIEGES